MTQDTNKNMCEDTLSTVIEEPHPKHISKNGDLITNKNQEITEKPAEEVKKPFSLRDELRINVKLIPIKIATLCYHGGVFAFLPFITLHMIQVGLSTEEIGLIYAILPVPSILGPLISGMLADKLKAPKTVVLTNLFCLAFFHTLLIFTPQFDFPPVVTVVCHEDPVNFKILEPLDCSSFVLPDAKRWTPGNSTLLDIKLNDCQHKCVISSSELIDQCDNTTNCYSKDFPKLIELEVSVTTVSEVVFVPLNSTEEIDSKQDSCTNLDLNIIHKKSFQCSACPVECQITGLLKNKDKAKPYKKTFWVYLALRTSGQFFITAAFTMMDAVTMTVIKDVGGDFGKQRLMTIISMAIAPFISSLFVYAAPETPRGLPDYSIPFYIGDALLFVSIVIMAIIEIKTVKEPVRNVMYEIGQVLAKFEVVVFLVVILILGSVWGFLESFFFVYLSELKAPPYLLGLTLSFGCGIGIPAMIFSDRIVEKMGRPNVFILSFIAYSVRLLGYSLIQNPWLALPFEALEVVTYQIMWVAAVTYFPVLAPENLLATMSALAGTTHYNIGRGVGALLGGNLMDKLDSRSTFRIFAAISLVSGIVYGVLHYCYLDKRISKLREKKKDAEEIAGVDNPSAIKLEDK